MTQSRDLAADVLAYRALQCSQTLLDLIDPQTTPSPAAPRSRADAALQQAHVSSLLVAVKGAAHTLRDSHPDVARACRDTLTACTRRQP
ncbi:hypothetical protein ACH46L_31670 [Streptomyces althioticus]|uniref:hypothetical protein n=1 Tax=Streptomyces althioticus TaxID=83380 RepID=UPI0037893334